MKDPRVQYLAYRDNRRHPGRDIGMFTAHVPEELVPDPGLLGQDSDSCTIYILSQLVYEVGVIDIVLGETPVLLCQDFMQLPADLCGGKNDGCFRTEVFGGF